MGLIAAGASPSDAELANLIFTPGFSTADAVTGLAGRGVGMDVVRADVNAMGGRIETATAAGRGTSFRLVLPLTTAVTQVRDAALRRTDGRRCRRRWWKSCKRVATDRARNGLRTRAHSASTIAACRSSGSARCCRPMPRGQQGHSARSRWSIIRSAAQRIALHVDEVLGNQEVVVKNLGPQLARLPGLAGMTLLPSGEPALIYNPVALATLYGESAWAMTRAAIDHARRAGGRTAPAETQAPLVLVVDDSLTVRRVTQRLLQREGYRVTLAKDGLEGLERLGEERPAVLLSDIEMPRMDGFDLVRNLRADAQARGPAGDHDHLAHRAEAQGLRGRARRRSLPRQAVRRGRPAAPAGGRATPGPPPTPEGRLGRVAWPPSAHNGRHARMLPITSPS